MKLVTFQTDDRQRLGAYVENKIFDLNTCYSMYLTGAPQSRVREIERDALQKLKHDVNGAIRNVEDKIQKELPACMTDFLQLGDESFQRAVKVVTRAFALPTKDLVQGTVYRMDEVTLEAPVPHPGKLLCLAGNYAEHIKEAGREMVGKEKMAPRIFMKPNTSIIATEGTIIIPKKGNKIDWEAELAVVIGKRGKYINRDEAYNYVAGYTIMNDVSERELIVDADREPNEWNNFFDWLNGKWMDTFAPMGPYLVTKDEVDDPHDQDIVLKVNGEVKQDSNTGNMIFTIPELIEFASSLMTLEPGDIISTGTPSGVGASSGTFLKDGDLVEVEIEKIGILKNVVRMEE